jgi:predicted SprT family Zn-dependent metalloprotease
MEHKCLNCGATSNQIVLISCEHKGEELYVCVKCLPVLIHGSH